MTQPREHVTVSPERKNLVERARQGWVRRLTDLSRRNNLLYFRELKVGTLDLSSGDDSALADFLAGHATNLARLVAQDDLLQASRQVLEIQRRAQANLEEHGIDTLYAGLGMATCPAADGGRPVEAPVLLVPVTVESKGRSGQTVSLRRSGAVQVNLVLLYALESEFGCGISPESILTGTATDDESAPFDHRRVFAQLRQAAAAVKDFAVVEKLFLGNFSFQKMAMVRDLRESLDQLAEHDLIAAISGDHTAVASLRRARPPINPREFDARPPEEEYLIRDADSTQQRAISAALALQDGVIQGPPGTGKSQTIANLVAEFAARGRRVLFVAEKRAALEVVLRRLEEARLGHLALDLHGADISRREVMRKIEESLALVRDSTPVDATPVHRPFADRRKRLVDHVERIHTPRAPGAVSVFAIEGELLRLPPDLRSTTRWRGADLRKLDRQAAESVRDLLREAGGFRDLFLRSDPSPWTGALLKDGDGVHLARETVRRLGAALAQLEPYLMAICATSGAPLPDKLSGAAPLLAALDGMAATLSVYRPDIFALDFGAICTALQPGRGGLLSRLWASLFNTRYRHARAAVAQLRQGETGPETLLAEAEAARDQLAAWRRFAPKAAAPQRVPEHVEVARERLEAVLGALTDLETLLARRDLGACSLRDLAALAQRLTEDESTLVRLPRLRQIEQDLERLGAGSIIAEIRTARLPAERWPDMFQHAWLTSCLDSARAENPALAGFKGDTHQQFVEEFRTLDRERLHLAAQRVRRSHAERAVAVMNAHPDQTALVRREAEKKSRHLPLRTLFAQAPEVLTALRPCWMASPLSVSQLLPADRRYFDIVLFDEASQVLPEDAIPAMLRASHAVVAGDKHQLPPTPFFANGGGDDDANAAAAPTAGFESLLDVMSSLTDSWPLLWHYRSRDESLIAFSNWHIYRENGQEMITFPGPGGPPAVAHVLVNQTPDTDGQEDSVSEEVRRAVDLILDHATQQAALLPERWQTLGVIAMGLKHAQRIQGALDQALRERPDLDDFFDVNRRERFFIKNLERVQGDERDVIILTIGYGKDRSGRLPYRFGPLLMQGGERRLNVAISRARQRMVVVSAFNHQDMDPNRSKARGVELLRLFLQYAASEGRLLGDSGSSTIPLNPFEQDIYEALTAAGIPLLPQWGASQYRIDFVAQHPTKPGQFVLAVECDGVSYHSSPTARDRDRLRQQHLEALGWRFHRIWSTDWFMRRGEEIQRTVEAYRSAVAQADQRDARSVGPADPPQSADRAPGSMINLDGAPPATQRKPRPPVTPGKKIDEYHDDELDALVRWMQSDGRLRTDDEILAEMVRNLGYLRRGQRIEAAIRAAIARVNAGGGSGR